MQFLILFIVIYLVESVEELKIGEILLPSIGEESEKYLELRKDEMYYIFTRLDHPNNLSYHLVNPFIYNDSSDLSNLHEYLNNPIRIDFVIIIQFDSIPVELINFMNSESAYFVSYPRRRSSYFPNLFYANQPNSVFMTCIQPFCLVYKRFHIWLDDRTKFIYSTFLEPQLSQYNVEYEVFNSSDLLSSNYQDKLKQVESSDANSPPLIRVNNVILNLLELSNSNIELINKVIDLGNLEKWNLYNIGNCDTRDLYYFKDPDINHIYCVSSMIDSKKMVKDLSDSLPDVIIDDFSLSLFYLHYLLNEVYNSYPSLYIFNLPIVKEILLTLSYENEYGSIPIMESLYVYKILAITELNKTTNITTFREFETVDPKLQPTDYPLSVALYTTSYNNPTIVIESNVIRIGLLFDVYDNYSKYSTYVREGVQYSIFKTNMNLFLRNLNIRLFYYSLTYNDYDIFLLQLRTLLDIYKCDFVYFDTEAEARDKSIALFESYKRMGIHLSPQEGKKGSKYLLFAGYTLFTLLDSMMYQNLFRNPIIVYDRSLYGRESLKNAKSYAMNNNYEYQGEYVIDEIDEDVVKNIIDEYDDGGTILLLASQLKSIAFLKELYPLNTYKKFVVFCSSLEYSMVKEYLTPEERDGHYIFGYYFQEALRYTDHDFEELLIDRYFEGMEVYNNFVFSYYISNMIGKILEDVGVYNLESLFILLYHQSIVGITGTILYNVNSYISSNINVLRMAKNETDNVIFGGRTVIPNTEFYPSIIDGIKWQFRYTKEQCVLTLQNICFTLILFPRDKYKMYLEYLSSMVNYVSLYHGINSCLFQPYSITQDYSSDYSKLYDIVEDFLKNHRVVAIYATEDRTQIETLIPLSEAYNVPIFVGFDVYNSTCSSQVLYFGNYISTYGPVAFMKTKLLFGDVFTILSKDNMFWNKAASLTKIFKRYIKEDHIDDREMECCKDNNPENVANYILNKMPNGGLIYTYFDSEDLLSFLKVMEAKNMLPPKYHITTMNDYRFEHFRDNPSLFEDFIFLGPFPYFDNDIPDSEFKIYLKEMGVKYSNLTIAEVVTLNNFYNSILFMRITVSKLSTFNFKQMYSYIYTTKFDVFADGEAKFSRNNFITKNFYLSKYSNGKIEPIMHDSLPFHQIHIPSESKICDCSSDKGYIDIDKYNVAIQRYTTPYPSLEYMIFYQSILIINYNCFKDFGAKNNMVSTVIIDGNINIEEIFDDLVSKNVSHIFVYNYEYELSDRLDRLLLSSNMLLWSMKIHMDKVITLGPNVYQIIDPALSYFNTRGYNEVIVIYNSNATISEGIKDYCIKNLPYIGVSVNSILDMKDVRKESLYYTYAILSHILTYMPQGGIVIIAVSREEIELIEMKNEIYDMSSRYVVLLTSRYNLRYMNTLPNLYAISHYTTDIDCEENDEFKSWIYSTLSRRELDVSEYELLYSSYSLLNQLSLLAQSYNPKDIKPYLTQELTFHFPHGDSILLKNKILSYGDYIIRKTEENKYTTIAELIGPYNESNLIENELDRCYDNHSAVYEVGYIYCNTSSNVYQSLMISMFLYPIKEYNKGILVNDTYINPILIPISSEESEEEWNQIKKQLYDNNIEFVFGYTCKSGRFPDIDGIITMNIVPLFEDTTTVSDNQFTFDVYMKPLIPFCSRWISHHSYNPIYILITDEKYALDTGRMFRKQLEEYGYVVIAMVEVHPNSILDDINTIMTNHFTEYHGTILSLLDDNYLYNYLASLNNVKFDFDIIHFGHFIPELIDQIDFKFGGNFYSFEISNSFIKTPVFKDLVTYMNKFFNTTEKQISQYSNNLYNSVLFFTESVKSTNSFDQDIVKSRIKTITVETATGPHRMNSMNFMTQIIYVIHADRNKNVSKIVYQSSYSFQMNLQYSQLPQTISQYMIVEVLLLHSFSGVRAYYDYYVSVAEMSFFDYYNEHTQSNIRILYHVYDCNSEYISCLKDAIRSKSKVKYIFAGNSSMPLHEASQLLNDEQIMYYEGHYQGQLCLNNIIIGGGLSNQIFATPINFFANQDFFRFHIFYSDFNPFSLYAEILVANLNTTFNYNLTALEDSFDYSFLRKYLYPFTERRVLIFLCSVDYFVQIVNVLDTIEWDFDNYPVFSPFYDFTQLIKLPVSKFYFLSHKIMNDSSSKMYEALAQYAGKTRISLREVIAFGTTTIFLYHLQSFYEDTETLPTSSDLIGMAVKDTFNVTNGLYYKNNVAPYWIFQMAYMKENNDYEIVTSYNDLIFPEFFNSYYEPGYICYYNGNKLEKHKYDIINIVLIYNNTQNMVDILDMTISEINEEKYVNAFRRLRSLEFNIVTLKDPSNLERTIKSNTTYAIFFSGDYSSLENPSLNIIKMIEESNKLLFYLSPSEGESCHHNIFYAGVYAPLSFRFLSQFFDIQSDTIRSKYILYTQTDYLSLRAFVKEFKKRFIDIEYVVCSKNDSYYDYAKNDFEKYNYQKKLIVLSDIDIKNLQEYAIVMKQFNPKFKVFYVDMRADNSFKPLNYSIENLMFIRSYNEFSNVFKLFEDKVKNRIPYSISITADMLYLYSSVNIFIRALENIPYYNLDSLRDEIYTTLFYPFYEEDDSFSIHYNPNHHLTHDLYLYQSKDGKTAKIIHGVYNMLISPYYPGVKYELGNAFCDWSLDKKNGDVLFHTPVISVALIITFTGEFGSKGRMLFEIMNGFMQYYTDTDPSYPFLNPILFDYESNDEKYREVLRDVLVNRKDIKILIGGLKLEEKNTFISLIHETNRTDVILYYFSLSSGCVCSKNVISIGSTFNLLKKMFLLETASFNGLIYIVSNKAQYSVEFSNYMINAMHSYGYNFENTIPLPNCEDIKDMESEVLRYFQTVITKCTNIKCIIYFAFINCEEKIIKELEDSHYLDNENITVFANYLDETTMKRNKYNGKSPLLVVTPSFNSLSSDKYSHLTSKTETIENIVHNVFGGAISISTIADTAYIVSQLITYALQYSNNSDYQYQFYKEESGISLYSYGGYINLDENLYVERYLYLVEVDSDGSFIPRTVSPDILIPDHYSDPDYYIVEDLKSELCDVSNGGKRKFITLPLIYSSENENTQSPRLLTLYAESYFNRLNNRYEFPNYYIKTPVYLLDSIKDFSVESEIINDEDLFCFMGCLTSSCRDTMLIYLNKWKKLLFYTGPSNDNTCDEHILTMSSSIYQKTKFVFDYHKESDYDNVFIICSKTKYGLESEHTIRTILGEYYTVNIPVITLLYDPSDKVKSSLNITGILNKYLQKRLFILDTLASHELKNFLRIYLSMNYNNYLFHHVFYNMDVYNIPDEIRTKMFNFYVVSSYMSDISTTDSVGFGYDVLKLIGKQYLNEGIESVYSSILYIITMIGELSSIVVTTSEMTTKHLLMTIQNHTAVLPSGRAILRANNFLARSTYIYRMSDSGMTQLIYPISSNSSFSEPINLNQMCYFGPSYETFTYSVALTIFTIIFTVILTVILFGVLMFLLKNKNKASIRRASLNFLILCIVALLIVTYSTFFIITVPQSVWICRLRTWGIGNGIVLLYAVLITKCWRLKALFRNPALKKKTITNKFLMQIILMICGLHIIFNIIWELSAPTTVIVTDITTDDITIHKYLYECELNLPFEIVDILIIVVLLLYGVIISWESRDIQREYNQSITLSLSIGAILLLGAISVPFDFTVFKDNKTGIVWFRMAVILTGVLLEIVIIYIPKFYDFYQNNYSGEATSSENNNVVLDNLEKIIETATQPPSPTGYSIRSSVAPVINKITPSQVVPVKIFSYKDIHTNKSDINYTFKPKSPNPRQSRVSVALHGSNSNSRPSSKSRKMSFKGGDYVLNSLPSLAQIKGAKQTPPPDLISQTTAEERKEFCEKLDQLKFVGSECSFSE